MVTLLGRLRPRIEPFGSSVTRFTVLPTDCDLNIHLNAGRFISFMDVARMDLLVRMRILRPMLARGWRPIMGGIVVRYRRSILPFERFDVRSRVVTWDEKWFYLEHVVEKNGVFCAQAYVRTLVRKRDVNVAPPDVLALIDGRELSPPPMPEFLAKWRNAEDAR